MRFGYRHDIDFIMLEHGVISRYKCDFASQLLQTCSRKLDAYAGFRSQVITYLLENINSNNTIAYQVKISKFNQQSITCPAILCLIQLFLAIELILPEFTAIAILMAPENQKYS